LIALLTQQIVWWHWVVLGLGLILVEMGTGTFIMLGFGLASIATGVAVWLFEPNFVGQIALWSVISVVTIALLFRYFKKEHSDTAGQSDHGLDTLGTVTEAIAQHGRGKVKFDKPVLGNTLWHATADEAIETGSRIAIKEVQGQLIKVTPYKEH